MDRNNNTILADAKRTIRRNGRIVHPTVSLVLSEYAQSLLRTGAEKFVENIETMDDAPFAWNSRERDTFIANVLVKSNYEPKVAAASITAMLKGVDRTIVAKTIDTMGYQVLKNAMFTVMVNYNQAVRRIEGNVGDNFFEQFNRRPAAENCEETPEDTQRAMHPIDAREETATQPVGCGDNFIELNGVTFQITTENDDKHLNAIAPKDLPERVLEGLEDARLHLENLRNAAGWKGEERMAFFCEPSIGEFIWHRGTAYGAVMAFMRKLEEGNRRKAIATENAFRSANEKLMHAA